MARVKLSKNYFHAIATMIGTTIGVGIFSVPYVVSQSGVLVLFIFLPVLVLVQYFLNKIYAEIILSTKDKHRIPGYINEYFSKKLSRWSMPVILFSSYGSLLAYIIIGGIFLHSLIGPMFGGSMFFYGSALFLLEIFVVALGLSLIASAEFFMTILLLFTILLIFGKSMGHIDVTNYSLVNWKNFFLPYGPIFYSLGGLTAIPSVCKLLSQKRENIKSALTWGTLIPPFVILFFTLAVVGVNGIHTTPDSLIGLKDVFNNGVVKIALIFGLLSIITSFLMIAQATIEVYWWDLKYNKKLAWVLSCLPPFFLYLIGLRNLTWVISLTGAIAGGLISIILFILLFRVKRKRQQKSVVTNNINKGVAYGLSIFFIFGIVYTIFEAIINYF